MYQYGGYCGCPQPQVCTPVGGGVNSGLAIILVLFILLAIVGCGMTCGECYEVSEC